MTDKDFDPNVEAIEERVVLFRGRNFAEAISRAEREARRYARDRHQNPYGQTVVTEYLGTCEAYWLFDPPGSGVEVFSQITFLPRGESRKALVDRWFGPVEPRRSRRYMKFLNRELFGDAHSNGSPQPIARARTLKRELWSQRKAPNRTRPGASSGRRTRA